MTHLHVAKVEGVVCTRIVTFTVHSSVPPCFLTQVGFSREGKLEAIELTAYQDCGHSPNENGFNIPFSVYPVFVDNGKVLDLIFHLLSTQCTWTTVRSWI